MSGRERRKGAAGENELRSLLEAAGFHVTAIQRNRGDELDTLAAGWGLSLAFETKRCETLRVPEWTRQAERGAPPGALPIVAYRRSREPWYAVAPLEPLLAMLVALGVNGDSLARRLHAADINIAALREALSRVEDAPTLPYPGETL
jgi:Holliday junction resolvase